MHFYLKGFEKVCIYSLSFNLHSIFSNYIHQVLLTFTMCKLRKLTLENEVTKANTANY